MTLLTQMLIALLPVVVVTTATAIYLNRRKSDKIYQRLFGLSDDPTDNGAMHELSDKIDSIDTNVKDLNHRRIDDIEDRLDTLQESMSALDARLAKEEDTKNNTEE